MPSVPNRGVFGKEITFLVIVFKTGNFAENLELKFLFKMLN